MTSPLFAFHLFSSPLLTSPRFSVLLASAWAEFLDYAPSASFSSPSQSCFQAVAAVGVWLSFALPRPHLVPSLVAAVVVWEVALVAAVVVWEVALVAAVDTWEWEGALLAAVVVSEVLVVWEVALLAARVLVAQEVVLVALRVFHHLGRVCGLVLVVLVLLVALAGMLASSIQLWSAEAATSRELHFVAGVVAAQHVWVEARHVWVAWHMAPWLAWMAQRTHDPAAVVPYGAFAAAVAAVVASAAVAAVVAFAAVAAVAASAAAAVVVPLWHLQPALGGGTALRVVLLAVVHPPRLARLCPARLRVAGTAMPWCGASPCLHQQLAQRVAEDSPYFAFVGLFHPFLPWLRLHRGVCVTFEVGIPCLSLCHF